MKPVFIAGIKSSFINDCRNRKKCTYSVGSNYVTWSVAMRSWYEISFNFRRFFYSIRHMVLGIIIPPKKGN